MNQFMWVILIQALLLAFLWLRGTLDFRRFGQIEQVLLWSFALISTLAGAAVTVWFWGWAWK